ncbi:exopolysaccharide biosynthesis polyprenyl glycosylphosphotransferase [Geodermatophilus dictyosporus]|uniref:Exopolysaccharide biosynthesis polyprenyl glycosylphosphotransferase n=1 Tax=Geodermatophilus dictyosporus TaxID=1523247 RepID=A0A1I5MY10_9ACTN|nr:sugar transferase [Geodermatophilus dictyosporus]SFP14350.1 exopolysaccharide biosynthesis polyprenyl glycosylphosphotransferase [Geodermatophilus dictyosporus]
MRSVHSVPLDTQRSSLRGDGTVARRAWRTTYVRRLVAADAACALVAAALSSWLAPGAGPEVRAVEAPALPLLTPLVWVAVMSLARAYEQRFLWDGPEEFRRVFLATAMLLAGVGTLSWALRLEVARGFVVVAVPLSCLFTLSQRYAQRTWLHHRRAEGRCLQTTLLVGHRSAVAALHEQLRREAHHGYRVIGCCLPSPATASFDGLPVLGDLDDVVDVVGAHEVDTVAVLPTPELDGSALRRLGWDLERTRAELLLAPAVTELAGPRVRIRPSCGLPLLHVERPELHGVRRLVKETFDRTAALVGLVLLLPLLLVVAAAVKASSPGPVFFRQERVGRGGQGFGMLKFRSMVVDADRVPLPRQGADDGNGVLFKLRDDPRVTPVGRVLRRYSLDELPQLLNVLCGQMSLVGPRPPLPHEVALYGPDMHRRFLVKPGLTGLWQVSGRSDLSWDDSVRIDVRYVENWSLTFDLMILGKTLVTVLRGDGAY